MLRYLARGRSANTNYLINLIGGTLLAYLGNPPKPIGYNASYYR